MKNKKKRKKKEIMFPTKYFNYNYYLVGVVQYVNKIYI